MSMSKAKAENRELPRRFYERADAAPGEGGWRIQLDGRVVKTPAKRDLVLPGEGLARAVAQEWDDQGERIDPFQMPLTRLTHVALDRMNGARAAAAQEIANFASTDLLSHRSDDARLAERQEKVWGPYLVWAENALDAPLKAAATIAPLAQPEASLEALKARALALDDFRLTGLVSAAPILTSAILAFALLEEEADAEAVWTASRLEEEFQIESWGQDAEAAEAAANRKRDLLACERLFRLFDAESI